MDITEKVIIYRRLEKEKGPASPEAIELKSQISREVLHLSYYIPQKFFKLQEEDASEFSLEIYREVDYLISNYKPGIASFHRFLNSYLEFRVRKFYNNKRKANHKEIAILGGHEYYEEKLQNEETQNRMFEPYTPRHLPKGIKKKMLFTFMRNPGTHKKFFLLSLTTMPFMSISSVTELCRLFRFDLNQTLKLCERLNILCNQQISETQRLEERRNYYWGRMLQLNEQIAAENTPETYNGNEDLDFLAELNRQKHRNRIRDLDERIIHVPHPLLASELGITSKTMNTMLYHARNYVSWLLGRNSQAVPDGETGINRRTAQEIEEGLWKDRNVRAEAVPRFIPSEHFKLKMFTETDK